MAPNIALFASGGGSNAQAIMDYFTDRPTGRVGLMVTNNPRSGALSRAARARIPALVLGPGLYEDGEKLVAHLHDFKIDFVALAGYLKLIPRELIAAYPNRIVNIHPALLPKFGGKGMYGMNVHRAVLAAGERESGPTIHYVTEAYDEGDIIFQKKILIQPDWNAEALQRAVLREEHRHYPAVIESLLKNL